MCQEFERPAEGPVTLTNADCPRCGGPVCYTPSRWLYCPACPPVRTATNPTTNTTQGK